MILSISCKIFKIDEIIQAKCTTNLFGTFSAIECLQIPKVKYAEFLN